MENLTYEDFLREKAKRAEQRKQKISKKYVNKDELPWWSYSEEKPWKRYYLGKKKQKYEKYTNKKIRQKFRQQIQKILKMNSDNVDLPKKINSKTLQKEFDLWWYII